LELKEGTDRMLEMSEWGTDINMPFLGQCLMYDEEFCCYLPVPPQANVLKQFLFPRGIYDSTYQRHCANMERYRSLMASGGWSLGNQFWEHINKLYEFSKVTLNAEPKPDLVENESSEKTFEIKFPDIAFPTIAWCKNLLLPVELKVKVNEQKPPKKINEAIVELQESTDWADAYDLPGGSDVKPDVYEPRQVSVRFVGQVDAAIKSTKTEDELKKLALDKRPNKPLPPIPGKRSKVEKEKEIKSLRDKRNYVIESDEEYHTASSNSDYEDAEE